MSGIKHLTQLTFMLVNRVLTDVKVLQSFSNQAFMQCVQAQDWVHLLTQIAIKLPYLPGKPW